MVPKKARAEATSTRLPRGTCGRLAPCPACTARTLDRTFCTSTGANRMSSAPARKQRTAWLGWSRGTIITTGVSQALGLAQVLAELLAERPGRCRPAKTRKGLASSEARASSALKKGGPAGHPQPVERPGHQGAHRHVALDDPDERLLRAGHVGTQPRRPSPLERQYRIAR